MLKKRGKANIIILFVLIILFAILSYFSYIIISDLRAERVKFIENKTIVEDSNQLSYSGSLQFYSNMRFARKNIFYHIDELCEDSKKERVLQAFGRLEQETGLLEFYYTQKQNSDILVSCENLEEQIEEKYFIVGEGGPTSIINTSSFYIIEKGKVLLFYEKSSCNNYNVELHELLHVFGFDHSKNKKSIMYSVTLCNQILTEDIVDELIRLYSIPELPDLYFVNVSAYKHGGYIDFNIEIRNKGLNQADDVILEIYAEDIKQDEFNLEDINYGEGKILETENIKIPRRTKQIKFILNSGEELDMSNNEIELILSV